ncbi:hypothetical protein DFQ14_11489 [Halopolyspora algeriensis]|uniref:Voltage-gated potassium channel n=1 Tax=Halopolyspora algeriensis TaxID=1500506 RepID=A0A368VI08_9ACTN|nr:ion transporter [Halopolyspora algeriensis]RCW39825.1 hypothetical protein DFQ14_11489 [Halopolyspora algeriensis]TQM56480.1 hypothetical protein FHU43_1279 [Halopolyspora algeriensis]
MTASPDPESHSDSDLERVLERHLHVPVLAASGASIPAVFLTALEGVAETVGMVINWVSMVVLAAESVLLFWASGDRLRWLRTHWWMVAIVALTIPAVIFAVGPAQVLRLARVVTAVQLIRVGKLLRVAGILRRRIEHLGKVGRVIWVGVLLLALVFLGIVLADPSTITRRALEAGLERWGWAVLLSIVLLPVLALGGTILALRKWLFGSRRTRPTRSEEPPESS